MPLRTVLFATSLAVWTVVSASTSVERFTATAIDGADIAHTTSVPVEIVVTRWSTDDEQAALMHVLRVLGPQHAPALADVLCELPPAGYIQTSDGVRHELHYARELTASGGTRRVVVAADRPVSFWPSAFRPAAPRHPFMFLELRLTANGDGEARASVDAAIVTGPPDAVSVSGYGERPLRLVSVRTERESS